ncbi:unnamed protein product [Phytophthora fragariaefolia]|uniref:Unnamed protein product n=1 Tax=Phytophthora fragariaefolia TaxID=1490495 RepID=A0A9W7CRR1_9STRA|nr:unnamed protein product [Phytophthora fragariaefolia]
MVVAIQHGHACSTGRFNKTSKTECVQPLNAPPAITFPSQHQQQVYRLASADNPFPQTAYAHDPRPETMTLDVAVKAPPPAAADAAALVLLHHDGHFRLLERSPRDFRRLERQLQQETSCASLPSLGRVTAAARSFHPPEQLAARVAVALERFLVELTSNSPLLAASLALKTFLHGHVLPTHAAAGPSYRAAVCAAIEGPGGDESELVQRRVAAGCSVEHHVAVHVAEGEKRLVLWKFASRGPGVVFSARRSSGEAGGAEIDPYSGSSDAAGGVQEDDSERVHYRTSCDFADGDGFVYGHFVAETTCTLTLQWENVDTSSVVSKSLEFRVNVVPLEDAAEVLEVVDTLKSVDSAEWLDDYVSASEVTALEELVGWEHDEMEDGLDDYAVGDNSSGEGPEKNSPILSAVWEERAHELEAQVVSDPLSSELSRRLATTKQELKSALDRVQIAEEIYKANLETITQLECVPKASKAPSRAPASPATREEATAPAAAAPNTQSEGRASSELERVQQLCAGFQEQCLWRSVENVELEARLAASQLEAASWREQHAEQAAQLEALALQVRTLRAHKKLLVQEVKRLQPYAHVNLAALVHEAQEARMVQRSLQAKLDAVSEDTRPPPQ